MNRFENKVRLYIYRYFAKTGHAPTAALIAGKMGTTEYEVLEGMKRLADEHILVLRDDPAGIHMAMPFSAVETPHRVRIGEREWWANCAWDALGIPAMLQQDASIDTSCPLSGDVLHIEVRDGAVESDAVTRVHFSLPAATWWDDIGYT